MYQSMSKKPLFSIIIPTLNEEKYLPLLLNDLSKQTLKDFEVIVIDGQSTDKTVNKAKSYQKLLPKIKLISSKIRNVSIQRNLGAKGSSGHYLIFNDADNRLPKYFLEGIKYQLTANPTDIFTCWSDTDLPNTKDKTISQACNLMLEASLLSKSPSAFGAMIGCKKDVFDSGNGFDPKVGFAEDKDFVVKYYKSGYVFKIYKDPKYVYSLRRFHSHGALKVIQKSSKLLLKYLTGKTIDQKKEYPMGGKAFEDTSKNLAQKLDDFLETPIKAPKIFKKLASLLNLDD